MDGLLGRFRVARVKAVKPQAPPTGTATPVVPEDTGADTTVDSFVGEVRLFAGTFAPVGWALCHGQLLPISGNEALFSLLGTTYGGDGRTTFGLPDLRGRTAVGAALHPGHPRQGESGTDPPGDGAPDHGYLALQYIISLSGVFPTRA